MNTDWGALNIFKPQPITDEEYQPFKGGYIGEVIKAGRQQGTKNGKDYNFHALSIKLTELKDGENMVGRWVSKTYNTMEDSEYGTALKAKKKLLTDYLSMGLVASKLDSDEAFDAFVESAVGKPVCIRASIYNGRQAVKIVKEIKARKTKPTAGLKEDAPF